MIIAYALVFARRPFIEIAAATSCASSSSCGSEHGLCSLATNARRQEIEAKIIRVPFEGVSFGREDRVEAAAEVSLIIHGQVVSQHINVLTLGTIRFLCRARQLFLSAAS